MQVHAVSNQGIEVILGDGLPGKSHASGLGTALAEAGHQAIKQGVHRGNPAARVIVWDWGWNQHRDAPEFVAGLPDDVWLMSVSEWAAPVERGGVKTVVGEYALCVVGPGPRRTASTHEPPKR